TSAALIASRIARVGRVTVSERKLIVRTMRAAPLSNRRVGSGNIERSTGAGGGHVGHSHHRAGRSRAPRAVADAERDPLRRSEVHPVSPASPAGRHLAPGGSPARGSG